MNDRSHELRLESCPDCGAPSFPESDGVAHGRYLCGEAAAAFGLTCDYIASLHTTQKDGLTTDDEGSPADVTDIRGTWMWDALLLAYGGQADHEYPPGSPGQRGVLAVRRILDSLEAQWWAEGDVFSQVERLESLAFQITHDEDGNPL